MLIVGGQIEWGQLENGLPLFFAAFVAVAGLVTLGVGIYMLWRAPVRRGTMREVRRRWGLDAAVDDATLRAAPRVLARIRAWALIFAGPGVTLVSIVWLSVAWLSEGNFRLVGIFNGWGLVLSAGIAIGILGCAGQAYGVHRLRARAGNHPAHADLRPRRVRDYVPIWVGVSFATWVLALVILTLVAWIFAKVPLRTQLGLDPNRWLYLPLGRWGLLAIPLLMALCLALGFGLLRWMVALPRLKSLDELPDVGVFDVYLRRDSIQLVLREYALLMFACFAIQWSLALNNVPPLSTPMPIEFIFPAAAMVNVLTLIGMTIGLSVPWWAGGTAGPAGRGSAPV